MPHPVLRAARWVPGGARVIWSGCPRFFVFLSSSRFLLSSPRFLSSSVSGARFDVPGGAPRVVPVLSCSGCPRFFEVPSARSVLSNSVQLLELPHLLAPEPDALHGDG